MKGWAIIQEGQVVVRDGFDGVNDPALFLDRASAARCKELYFPFAEYELVEIDLQIGVKNA